MESVGSSLKQMRENVCAVQEAAVPGLTSWGQDGLDQCQARWDVLSKQVRREGQDLCVSVKLVYTLVHFYVSFSDNVFFMSIQCFLMSLFSVSGCSNQCYSLCSVAFSTSFSTAVQLNPFKSEITSVDSRRRLSVETG